MTSRNFTPFPVLTTARLTLRQLSSSDDQQLFALRSNESVNQYLDRQPSKTLDEARKFIETITANGASNQSLYWVITLSGTDTLIGTICLLDFSDKHLQAEIGYELLPSFQGQGLMQEAISKVIDFGFQQVGLSAIVAYTRVENRRSTSVLQKLHFKEERAANENVTLFKLTSTNGK